MPCGITRVEYMCKDHLNIWLTRYILPWLSRETGLEFVRVTTMPTWDYCGVPFPKEPEDPTVARAHFFMRSTYPQFPHGGAAIRHAFVVCIESRMDVDFHRARTFHELCHAVDLPADDMKKHAPGCFDSWWLRLLWYIYRFFGWNVDIPLFQIAYYRWLWRWCDE